MFKIACSQGYFQKYPSQGERLTEVSFIFARVPTNCFSWYLESHPWPALHLIAQNRGFQPRNFIFHDFKLPVPERSRCIILLFTFFILHLTFISMASNLIEMFHNTVGEPLAKQASGLLGESYEGTMSAVQAIVPTLFAAISQKSASDEGASAVLKFIDDNNLDGSILTNVSGLLIGNIETEKLMYSGAVLLRYLLNDKISPVVDLISGPSGLKTSSATSLLKLSAPMVMGILGKHIQEKGLDAQGLKTLLKDQKVFINEYLPKGMDEALGMTIKPGNQSQQEPGDSQTNRKTSFSKLLPWIVLLITALGLYYFVQKGCHTPPVEEPQTSTPVPVDTATSNYVKENDPFKAYTLPDGTLIKALPNSFTGKLAEFLASTETGEKCFIFDRVNFESGSFKIAAGSERQLRQLASLLKGYPEVKVSIEGHTDDEGDDSKNKNLSKERARVIKEWLVEQEIVQGRMDAKGWGEEKPIASNETPGGREKNRRIEVCAIKK